jgi:hypothetical protein
MLCGNPPIFWWNPSSSTACPKITTNAPTICKPLISDTLPGGPFLRLPDPSAPLGARSSARTASRQNFLAQSSRHQPVTRALQFERLSRPLRRCKGDSTFRSTRCAISRRMPLLRRLLWPLGFVLAAAAVVGLWVLPRYLSAVGVVVALALPGLFGVGLAFLWGSYQRWSHLPELPDRSQLSPPEPAVWVSRGGFLTPGTCVLTPEALVLYALGRPMITLPLSRIGSVSFVRGRFLRTPYLAFSSPEGTPLGRVGIESAERWAGLMRKLLEPRGR